MPLKKQRKNRPRKKQEKMKKLLQKRNEPEKTKRIFLDALFYSPVEVF
jgi:hypothetical protein